MKKLMLMVLVLSLAVPAAMALDATDLDAANVSHSSQFGCGACHDAHNRNLGSVAAAIKPPLWGRAASTQTLTAYTLTNTARGALTLSAPSGSSMLCMSCHDGVSNPGTAKDHQIDGTGDGGYVNTAVMHPISFEYTTWQGTNASYFKPSSGFTKVKLFDSKLECGSCHDIHGATNTNDGTANTDALRGDGSGEDLCIECHTK